RRRLKFVHQIDPQTHNLTLIVADRIETHVRLRKAGAFRTHRSTRVQVTQPGHAVRYLPRQRAGILNLPAPGSINRLKHYPEDEPVSVIGIAEIVLEFVSGDVHFHSESVVL